MRIISHEGGFNDGRKEPRAFTQLCGPGISCPDGVASVPPPRDLLGAIAMSYRSMPEMDAGEGAIAPIGRSGRVALSNASDLAWSGSERNFCCVRTMPSWSKP